MEYKQLKSFKDLAVWIAFLYSIFYILNPAPTFAAALVRFIDRPAEYSGATDFAVALEISSAEPLNAFDITIKYPAQFLRVRSVNTANSIIDLWQEIPKARDGTLYLRGGSKTPFKGENGELATINFYAIAPGQGTLELDQSSAYIADGRGTPAQIRAISSPISIALLGIETPSDNDTPPPPAPGFEIRHAPPRDTNPPEIRFLEIAENPVVPGEYLLVFEAADAESGIRQVFARSKKWFWWGPWYETKNPHPLPGSAWKAQLRVMDNFGNTATETITQKDALAEKIAVSALALIAGIAAMYMTRYRAKKRIV